MPADQATTAPADLQQIRDRIALELEGAQQFLEDHIYAAPGYPAFASGVANVAAALDSVDRVIARAAASEPQQLAPGVVPAFDLDGLCADVWNRLQEVGHPTSVSDDAVDAIRLVLEGRPPVDQPTLLDGAMDSGASG